MSESQRLIDLTFAIALQDCDTYAQVERKAAWVARQLRANGFDTQPMGMSWGVLVPKTAFAIPAHAEPIRLIPFDSSQN